MELTGIEQALRYGCRLHAFRSGAGLRVVRIEKDGDLVGYGEHPHASDALSHANEDILAGGRPYDEVYGCLKPHYLTGSSSANDELDLWLLQGHTFDVRCEGNEFVFELKGFNVLHSLRNERRTGRGISLLDASKAAFEATALPV